MNALPQHQVLETPSAASSSAIHPSPIPRTVSIGVSLSCLLIFGSALAFGSVHERPFEILRLTSAILALNLLFFAPEVLILTSRTPLIFGRLILLYLGTLLVCSFSWSVSSPKHPLLGDSYHLTPFSLVLDYSTSVIWLALLVLMSYGLFRTQYSVMERGIRGIVLCGLGTAAVALLHWLHDDGLLFGVFEPEFVVSAERARWPFVNPNHLGHFLLIPLAFSFFVVLIEYRAASRVLRAAARGRRASLSFIYSLPNVQKRFLSLFFWLGAACIILLAFSLTLSRSSWIAASFLATASALFSFRKFTGALEKNSKSQSQPPLGRDHPSIVDVFTLRQLKSGRRVVRKHYIRSVLFPFLDRILFRPLKNHILSILLVFSSSCLLFVFLQSGSFERIDTRLESTYGKIGMDDTRLILYEDSIQMFLDAPLFGHGISTWSDLYSRYKSAELADAKPRFLHSDPYQHLIELGILGSLPLFLFMLWLVKRGLFPRRKTDSFHSGEVEAVKVIARLSVVSLAALLLASFFDFPFHIPAITTLSAVVCGLALAASEPATKTSFSG